MTNMLILITGATGSVGKKLTDKLQNSGYRLRILERKVDAINISGGNIERAKGSLEDIKSLNEALSGIDIVIHLAGITHTNKEALYFKINTGGTKNLIKACKNNGVKKFIYISSRTACEEGGAYAKSKLLAEKALLESDLDWVILRPAEIYGAGGKEAISKLINIIEKSPFIPIIGNGQYLLSPVHADDLIQSILAILKNNAYSKKIYTIAGPEEFTYSELTDKISKILGVKRRKIFIPLSVFEFLAFVFYLFKKDILVRDQIPRLICKKSSDIAPAKKELGFNPRTLKEGIKLIRKQPKNGKYSA